MGESACAHVGGRAATLIASTAPFGFCLFVFVSDFVAVSVVDVVVIPGVDLQLQRGSVMLD